MNVEISKKTLANYIINDLLRYWKKHSEPCLMPVHIFYSFVWSVENECITKKQFQDRLHLFFTDEKYRADTFAVYKYLNPLLERE